MAIDYDKVEQNKAEFGANGNPANAQYQQAFIAWLDRNKEDLEADIQQYLEEKARSGEDGCISIRAYKVEDYYEVEIWTGVYSYTSPADIFDSFFIRETGRRHYFNDDEMKEQFEWYCNKFEEFFDEIRLRYKPSDIYFHKGEYLIKKIFI